MILSHSEKEDLGISHEYQIRQVAGKKNKDISFTLEEYVRGGSEIYTKLTDQIQDQENNKSHNNT